MRINRPLIHSYHVVRLRDIKNIRSCVPVSRKHIFTEYSKIHRLCDNSYEISLHFADKVSGSVLGYCPYNQSFYPLSNFDPDIKYISTPTSYQRSMNKHDFDNKW